MDVDAVSSVLGVQRLTRDAELPARQTSGAAGYDLYASASVSILPGKRALVPTGIAIALPEGHYGRVAPRSSLAVKGIDVSAGVIDADYRGEVKVLLLNAGFEMFTAHKGTRIAQLIVERVFTGPVVESDLDRTSRGSGGFGSTGTGAEKAK